MAKISRDRGKRFEREVANLFKDWGYDAHRTVQFCGKTGQAADVEIKDSGLHVECKMRKSIAMYEWYEQAVRDSRASGRNDIPIVVYRADGKPPMVTMHFEDFIRMFNEYHAGMMLKEVENDRKDGKDTDAVRQDHAVHENAQERNHAGPCG